jgi:hypothetical protein
MLASETYLEETKRRDDLKAESNPAPLEFTKDGELLQA